jgi:hypothetical protein
MADRENLSEMITFEKRSEQEKEAPCNDHGEGHFSTGNSK